MYQCSGCEKTHTYRDEPASSLNGKTCECGAYVITPEGRAYVTYVLACQVYLFDDGERHWIVAHSEKEAKEYFETYSGGEEEYCEVNLVEGEELEKESILNTENPNDDAKKYISLKELALFSKQIPNVIATNVY